MGSGNAEVKQVVYSKILIDELLDRMNDVKLNGSVAASVCKNWSQPKKYMEESAQQRESKNFSTSVSLSKKAVCVAIDRLLYACHLEKYFKKNYVQKIEIFEKMGIEIPLVIHDLIINVRNRDEHEYTESTLTEARYAFEIATLFLGWLKHLDKVSGSYAVVFAGDCDDMFRFQQMLCCDEIEEMVFEGAPDKGYLFFDESEARSKIKLINPSDCQGWYLCKDELSSSHIQQIREILAIDYPDEIPSRHWSETGQFDTRQVSVFVREKAMI